MIDREALRRDPSAQRPGDTINALAFFDDVGPGNDATHLVPRSHRGGESRTVRLSGSAGNFLVFDADLVPAGSVNPSGARRRSVLIG